MAEATRTGNAIIFDAATDTWAGKIVEIAGITFQGNTLVAGNILLLTDDQGSPIVDYAIEAPIDNADFWNGRDPQFCQGLKLDATSLVGGGVWRLTVFVN